MHPRPSHPRRSSALFHGEHARRDSRRRLAFEMLENRTLLAADFAPVNVPLDLLDGYVPYGPAESSLSTPSNIASANGYRLEVLNATSPDADEPSVDDVLVLRVIAEQLTPQQAVTFSSQVDVTFDSSVVALDEVNEAYTGLEFELADSLGGQVDGFRYRLRTAETAAVPTRENLLLQVPFRVIAPGDTSFFAKLSTRYAHSVSDLTVPAPVSNVQPSGLHDLGQSHGIGGVTGGSAVALDLTVSPGWIVPEAAATEWKPSVHENEGTTNVRRPLPPLTNLIPERESEPFEGVRTMSPPTESFFNMTAASASDLDSSMQRPSFNLSADSTWNRHRPLSVAGGDDGLSLRRSATKSSSSLTSRLLNDDTDLRSSRLGKRAASEFRLAEQDDSSRVTRVATTLGDTGTAISQLIDKDAQVARVTVLRAEDCDAILKGWPGGATRSAKIRPNSGAK